MNEYLLKAVSLRQLKQSEQVRDMAVHAAVGQKAVQMKRTVIFFAVLNRRKKRRVLKEVPIGNLLGDSGQLLIYNTACSHI